MLKEGSSVRALAMNSKDNILYAINDTNVYTQQNPMLNLALKPIVSIGDETSLLQTLSLTNNVNELLVGNSNGAFKVTGSKATTGGAAKPLANNKLQSIVSSYIDQETNIVYFADSKNNLGVYKNESLTEYELSELAGKNNLVAANSGAVYVSSSRNLPFGNNKNSAILYKFITENNDSTGKLVEIKTSNKPFESTSIKKLFFADMDENRVNLYAASNTGKLYRLDTMANPPKWELKADINTTGSIQDVVVDNLRNIYIAVDGKVLRIKNHESTAIELPDYTDTKTKPASLVVDNNDDNQSIDKEPSAFKCKADGDKPCGCLEDGNGLTWYRDASQNTGNWYDWCSTSGSAANNKCSTNGAKLVRFNKDNHCGISNWHLPTLYQHDFNDSFLLYVNRADGNFGSLVRHAKANNWNGNFAYPDFYSWLSNNFTVLPISNTVRPKIYWSQLSYDENQFYGMLLWNGSLNVTDGRSDVGVALLVSGDTNFLNNEEVLDIRKQHKNFTPGYKDRAYIYEMTFNLNNNVANLIKGYSVKIDENPEKYRDANRNANSMNINFREYNNNYGINQSSGVIIKAVLFTGQKITVFAGNPY